MRCDNLNEKEWITLKEASKITGKSVHAFRQLINRGRVEMVKKMQDNGPGYWVIHRDHLNEMIPEKVTSHRTISSSSQDTSQCIISDASQMVTIPAEVYIQQQREHDNMVQGLMMYRYKFEEAEKQMKLLPAPAETIAGKIDELEETLSAEVQYREQLTSALQEKEAKVQELEADLRQARLPWWKKMLKMR